jgi:hypothetical protein
MMLADDAALQHSTKSAFIDSAYIQHGTIHFFK